MTKWIPVSEELPDDDRWVLISVRAEKIPTIGHLDTFVHRLNLTDDGKQYTAWTDIWGYEIMNGDVTAWMPLPEPYKESNNGK